MGSHLSRIATLLGTGFDQAAPGTVYVINRYRNTNATLRTHLLRIIKRAGLKSWPKLFQNLRATRETELAKKYPIHVVCSWIGNNQLIAAKHYLQVTDDDFEQAANGASESDALIMQNPVQQPAAPTCSDSQDSTEAQSHYGFGLVGAGTCEVVQTLRVPPTGLEPVSSG